MAHTDRVIVLVDMDCFYCQVEERLNPSLEGKPIAVVQYNAWRGGGIIAVNYPARGKGVTRHMRGDEAKRKCPDIVLARVPNIRGKADLTKYREAGKRVAEVLQPFTTLLERASVDEAYLDITEAVKNRLDRDFEQVCSKNMQNTYVVGSDTSDFLYNVHKNRVYCESNCLLAMGGLMAEEIRAEVLRKTGYKCSAGIAHNKILAKLVCGLHKPNKQTILPHESVPDLYKNLPIRKINSLGGKFGNTLSEELNITNMGELGNFNLKELIKRFDEKTGNWLYNIARGIDLEPVKTRLVSKSIGCCKKFPGKTALITYESVQHWINELAEEILERLEKDAMENNRRAKQMVVTFAQEINKRDVNSSRTISLNSYDKSKIAQNGMDILKKFCLKADGTYNIKFLGMSVGNFEENKKMGNIKTFFKNINDHSLENSLNKEKPIVQNKQLSPNELNLDESTTKIYNYPFHSLPSAKETKISILDEENILSVNVTSEENSCADENTSVYSATTEELNEDPKSLIYYEDIYPESIASQSIIEVDNNNISNVSNSNDSKNLDSKVTSPSASSSFFNKYFVQSPKADSSQIERNFDTSKILEETDMECSRDNYYEDGILLQTRNNFEESQVELPYEQMVPEEPLNLREACSECNKKILISDLASHMDYHYALKIVKDEAHLFAQVPHKLSPEPVKVIKKSSVNAKRKVTSKPIETFLSIQVVDEENSELCTECNKRIKLDDVVSHSDYHAAKKLHLEINSNIQTQTTCKTFVKPTKIKEKPKANRKPATNILSFFKSS